MVDYLKEYDKIKADVKEWCKFDLMNIGEKAMQAINKKQWIVARLYDAKRDREKIIKARNLIKKQNTQELVKKSPVDLNKGTIDAASTPDLDTMEEQLKNCEFLIRYLEDLTKMFMFIAQDIKNVIESIKLESE